MSNIGLPTLTIQAYTDIDRSRAKGKGWIIPYQPDSLKLSLHNDYAEQETLGTPGGSSTFKGAKSSELSVTLLLFKVYYEQEADFKKGSGRAVKEQLKLLYESLYQLNGDTHLPSFLSIAWGEDLLLPYGRKKFLGVLSSVNAKERHSGAKGEATYLEVECRFIEQISRQASAKAAKLNSPDLTHHRQVIAGDRLDYKTWQIYGTPGLGGQVARNNDLDSPRLLTPGQTLSFAPYRHEQEPRT